MCVTFYNERHDEKKLLFLNLLILLIINYSTQVIKLFVNFDASSWHPIMHIVIFELCNWIAKTQSIPFPQKLKRPFHCISFRPVKLNRQSVRPQIRRELDIFIPPTTGFINPQFGDLDISFYFTFCEFWDFPPTLEWQNNDPDFP